jgi:hypothetical protein
LKEVWWFSNPNQNYGDNNFNSQAPKSRFWFCRQLGAAGNVVEGLAEHLLQPNRKEHYKKLSKWTESLMFN